MRMSEKCLNSNKHNNNNNSDNPLTSRRTDGGKKGRRRIQDEKLINCLGSKRPFPFAMNRGKNIT